METLVAKIQSGEFTTEGVPTFKSKTIDVLTPDLGRLVFDKESGKAKSGSARLTNLADLLNFESKQKTGTDVMFALVMHRWNHNKLAIVEFNRVRQSKKILIGKAIKIHMIRGTGGLDDYHVGHEFTFDERRDRGRNLTMFDSLDAGLVAAARQIVQEADRFLQEPREWEDAQTIRPNANAIPTGVIRAECIKRADEDRDQVYPTSDNLFDYIFKGMRPTLVMVEPKKPKEKKS